MDLMQRVANAPHNPISEKIVGLLRKVNQNTESDGYFRTLAAFYLAQVASTMRAGVDTEDRGLIPVNVYALLTAPSGFGKTKSVNIIERSLLGEFYNSFTEQTLAAYATHSIEREAARLAERDDMDLDTAILEVGKEYDSYGAYVFSFPEGSGPAYRQVRAKCQMANIGSTNFICDEIGFNLMKNGEALDVHFECYTGDVEVLTNTGYVRFDALQGTESIAQYVPNGNIEYVSNELCGFIQKPYAGTVYDFITPTGFDFTVTENHMMTVSNQTGELLKVKPADVHTGHRFVLSKKLPNLGKQITNMLRLQLAFQADGTFRSSNAVEFAFNKPRKIARLTQLLDRMQVTYTTGIEQRGYTRFHLSNIAHLMSKDLTDFINPAILDLNQVHEILEELGHWDGHVSNTATRYTTTHKANAELVAWIASVSGFKSRIRTCVDKRSDKYKDIFYVEWNNRFDPPNAQVAYLDKPSGKQPPIRVARRYTGNVYCVTVPSTHIIIRRNGVSVVGGNCYDVGLLKDKITKASSDNKRYKQRSTPVPANLLAFGTPDKLFDGGVVEKELMTRLDSGYVRRFLYASGTVGECENITPEELYDRLVNASSSNDLEGLSNMFMELAGLEHAHRKIPLLRAQGIMLTAYKMHCDHLANEMPNHQAMNKAEMQHRYFRALKLAGAYAFVERTDHVTTAQLLAAIKTVEESGKAFDTLMARPKAHVRLAQFIAATGEDLTHVDIMEQLPFYAVARNKQEEMLTHAIAWGHTNHVIIKKTYVDNIEFLRGETLKINDLTQLRISMSTHEAFNYFNKEISWEQIPQLVKAGHLEWVNHHLMGEEGQGHRCEEKCKPGFNLLILDVDGECQLAQASALLSKYKCMFYTTKRHTEEINRFRIILPMSYELELNAKDYKDFMNSVYEWLPFGCDTSTGQRSRKWTSYGSEPIITEGVELFDPRPFIPKTTKNQEMKAQSKKLGNLSKVERWFVEDWAEGGRNNTLVKYALMLLDSGMDPVSAEEQVYAFNDKMADALPREEVGQTVIRTIQNRARN